MVPVLAGFIVSLSRAAHSMHAKTPANGRRFFRNRFLFIKPAKKSAAKIRCR
jgi:hypothetical protein